MLPRLIFLAKPWIQINLDVSLTPPSNRGRWILNQLQVTKITEKIWLLTTNSKFSASICKFKANFIFFWCSYHLLFDLKQQTIKLWKLFGYSIDAAQQQMALNFELVVSDQLFSVVLAGYKWFKISATALVFSGGSLAG